VVRWLAEGPFNCIWGYTIPDSDWVSDCLTIATSGLLTKEAFVAQWASVRVEMVEIILQHVSLHAYGA